MKARGRQLGADATGTCGMSQDQISGEGGRYRLAVDGACCGNPGPGGWAVLVIRPDGAQEVVSGRVAERTTNNRMEVMAVVEGLRRIPEGAEVEVQTDSQLVIGWLAQGYARNNVTLAPLLDAADALMRKRTVRFVKVRGHAGDPRNELVNARAEAEATAAAHG